MSQTLTMQNQVGTINPTTGHMITEDDVAVNQAIGPDRADPPSQPASDRYPRRPYGGGLPGGGPPGGGGGGPPGGGGGGSPGANLAPLQGQGRGSDKLIGNPPTIFTGDKSKSEEFSTQWQLYEGVNMTNNQMRIPFQRAMLFLTYLQGPLVNEWVKAMSAWLRLQITTNHVRLEDEWLWESTMQAFNRQFADVLEQEKAKALLRRGFKMEGSNLDAYISKFEQTVRHAGLNCDDPLVLDKFTDGLPTKMYEDIYTHKQPRTYEQWRHEAINQQKAFVHLKARLNSWRTTPTPAARPVFNQWRGAPRDPNAMDTSQGRVRSRLANAEQVLEDFRNRPPQPWQKGGAGGKLPHVTPGKSFVTTVTNQDIWLAHAQHHAFKGDNNSHPNTHLALIKIDKCNKGPAALDGEKRNSNTTTLLKLNAESSPKELSTTEATGVTPQIKTNKSHGQ